MATRYGRMWTVKIRRLAHEEMPRKDLARLALFAAPLIAWDLCFCVVPLVNIARLSMLSGTTWRHEHVYSLANYERVFSPLFVGAVARSGSLAFCAAVLSATVALGLVLATWHLFLPRPREVFLRFIMLLFFAGVITRLYAFQFMLSGQALQLLSFGAWRGGGELLYTVPGIILAYLSILLPVNVAVMYVARRDVRRELEDAARDLGAGAWIIERRIVLPLMRQAVVVAVLVGFVLTFADVVVSDLIGGGRIYTSSLAIIDLFKIDQWSQAAAAAIGVLLIQVPALAFLSSAVLRWMGR